MATAGGCTASTTRSRTRRTGRAVRVGSHTAGKACRSDSWVRLGFAAVQQFCDGSANNGEAALASAIPKKHVTVNASLVRSRGCAGLSGRQIGQMPQKSPARGRAVQGKGQALEHL